MKTLNQKRLAKVIALGLVVGGFSFANVDNVYAANIGNGQKVVTDVHDGYGPITGKHYVTADKNFTAASQKDLVAVNKEAEQAKATADQAKEDATLASGKAQIAKDAAAAAQKVATDAYNQATTNAGDIADLQKDKADKTYVDNKVAGKADQSAVDDLTNKVNTNTGAIADLQKDKADKADVDKLNTKVENNKAEQNLTNQKLQNGIDMAQQSADIAEGKADAAQNTADTALNQANQNKAAIDDLNVKVENNEEAIKDVNTKVDQNSAKTQEQIDNINDKNAAQDVTINQHTQNIAQNREDIKTEAAAREEADKNLSGKIDQAISDGAMADIALEDKITDVNAKVDTNAAKTQEQIDNINDKNAAQDVTINQHTQNIAQNREDIKTEAAAREEADKNLSGKIEQETSDRVMADIALEDKINENTGAIADVDAKVDTETTNRIDADNEIRQNIQNVDTKFSGEVSRLDSRIDKVDDKINKVGAMAAAIANLHTMGYDPEAPTEFAMSVGQYRDETGMAIGLFHYPNRDFMLSLSVSRAGEEYMGGIGATWKFGRKSPEKMLAEQKEKAAKEKLAKAEAMKEAARQARVEAQMARHAKMLAEREAAK